MDLNYTSEDLAFRDQVCSYLADNLPEDLKHKVLNHKRLSKDDFVRWHKTLAKQGWVATGWPKEYGGTGWTATQRHIFEEECARAGTPGIMPFGVAMVAPVIMAFGNQAQKDYYLPRILNCDDWWCQGYSEPGSGSDLASLKNPRRTRRRLLHRQRPKDLDHAGPARRHDLLPGAHRHRRAQTGRHLLPVDRHETPGITVRPIIMLDEEHEVNEVFFDNVKVPVQNLIGEENKGWTYAKYLLGHERTNIAAVGRAKRELQFLKRVATEHHKNGKPLLDDPVYASKVASLEVELMALEITVLRVISQDSGRPGPEASLLKIKGTEIQQRLTELMVEAIGPYSQPFDHDYLEGKQEHSIANDDDAAPLAAYYFNFRKTSIYGGSNEIQKNIITQMILGL